MFFLRRFRLALSPSKRAEKQSLQTQRVFLYCAPANVADRDKLIEDLLSNDAGIDCMVQYVDSPDAPRDETKLENEMTGTKALVLWVTPDLLSAIREKKIPVEYTLAQKLKLPVLPIATFPELLPEFSRLVAPVHAIARSDNEYRAKLREQLERLLVTDEQRKAIREKAFTAEIFVSYRKVDIEEAQRFMTEFHDILEFETVSIWYDSFLTAGRDFNEEIKEAITTSDAFALVVTPNLLLPNKKGKPNYVQTTEYPFAKEAGKPIIPVETLDTDSATFTELFPGTDELVPLKDTTALRDAFRAKLGDAVTPKPLDSERAYYLGMAYLRGYGVERDFDRAVKLLEKTSEEFSISALRATEQLTKIYQNGTGTSIDYDKALHWWKKTALISEDIFGTEHPNTATSYYNIGVVCLAQGYYHQALKYWEKVRVIRERVLGKEHPDTVTVYNTIGEVYRAQDDYHQALEWHHQALAVQEKVLGKGHLKTAMSYSNIGNVYISMGNYSLALEWHKKALAIKEKVLDKEYSKIARSYSSIGIIYDNQGDYPRALEWQHKALAIQEKVLGAEHPDTATTYDNIGVVYAEQIDYPQALKWQQKALAVREKVLGKEHPDTATSYNNIGATHGNQGDYLLARDSLFRAFRIRYHSFGMKHSLTNDAFNNMRSAFIANGGREEDFMSWLNERMKKVERGEV